jgi:hypothetical protein
MAAVRIMMCPVYDTALVVPDVLTGKLDSIPDVKGFHSRRDVNIVRHQKRLPGLKLKNEPLVPVAFVIIAELTQYRSLTANCHIAFLFFEKLLEDLVARGGADSAGSAHPNNADETSTTANRRAIILKATEELENNFATTSHHPLNITKYKVIRQGLDRQEHPARMRAGCS